MQWIDAGSIKYWLATKERHCQDYLSELIIRLLSPDPSIKRIDFQSPGNVTTGGLDGYLETPTISPFYPSGISVWEFSSDGSSEKKAEENYTKRTADPQGVTKNNATFVFVTPRPMPGRRKWESSKRALKEWNDVRAIACDELVTWMASTPAVAKWLAREIGIVRTDSIRDLEDEWNLWSAATRPAMTPDIVVSGRTKDVGAVHQWLGGRTDVLELQGDSPEEARAFLYAAITCLPEIDRRRALSRCLVVQDNDQFVSCADAFRDLIIAAPAECAKSVGHALDKGHHVFLAMNVEAIDLIRIKRLQRPQRAELEKALVAAGLPGPDAQREARESGRSIPVVWRRLLRASAKEPDWAKAEAAATLLPALLAGAWMNDKDGDRQILETLSGDSYDDFIERMEAMALLDDAPVRRVGNVWMLKSPLDAWFLTARHLNSQYLKKFRQVVTSVLTKTDPKYELPADKRWAASIYDKAAPYSEWLRKGLVESLTVLGGYGEECVNSNLNPQDFANITVNEILSTPKKWEAWASLKDVTPLLAEAAPDSFLDVMEQEIANNPSLFSKLLQDEKDLLTGECKHSGLLWALESVAWQPTYFARAAEILYALSKIDPGGRWSNRPFNSLRDVLMPAFPQTYATPSQRLKFFDKIVSEDAALAWKLVERNLSIGAISASYKFRWRDSGGVREGLDPESKELHQEYIGGLLSRWGDLVASRPAILASAVDNFLHLPSQLRDRVISSLGNLSPDTISKEDRDLLLAGLRHTLNWLNSFGSEEQRLDVPALKRELERLTPSDVIERIHWLFAEGWPRLPEGESKDYKVHSEAVANARRQAARDLLDNLDLEKILSYAKGLQYVGIFVQALGTAVRDEKEDDKILDAMIGHVQETPGFVMGYSIGRIETVGNKWASQQIARIKAKGNYSPTACAAIYFGLPEGGDTWSAVSANGPEVESLYWKWASGYSRPHFADDAPFAVEKLLDADRPDAALRVAGDPQVSIATPLLQRLLQAILSLGHKERLQQFSDGMFQFYISNIFNQLYDRNDLPTEEIARLEWAFAPAFDRFDKSGRGPLTIHRTLQKDPSFFAQFISFIYNKDDGSQPSHEGMTKEEISNIATNAYEILESWHLLPGLIDDGSINENAFRNWVLAARERCAEIKCVKGCDLQLAEVFARMPADKDGIWPHTAVRNLIEELKNLIIETHIPVAIYNYRGVITRNIGEGGVQERESSEKYEEWSKLLNPNWPRTAKVLHSLAEMYGSDAKRIDIFSELDDLRWG